jgi:ribosomal protein L1
VTACSMQMPMPACAVVQVLYIKSTMGPSFQIYF